MNTNNIYSKLVSAMSESVKSNNIGKNNVKSDVKSVCLSVNPFVKSLFIFISFISFISLMIMFLSATSTPILSANYPCKHILWGYILSNGYAVEGYTVVLQDIRTCRVIDKTTTKSDGSYIFWLFNSPGGTYNVSVDAKVIAASNYTGSGTSSAIGGSVTVVEGRAVRMDLDMAGNKFLTTRNQQSTGYICYLSDKDDYYHCLSCKYFKHNGGNAECYPMPYDYVLYGLGMDACPYCLSK